MIEEFQGRFPIYEISGDITTTSISVDPCNASSFTTIRKVINDLRNKDCDAGDCEQFYIGLLADQSSCSGFPINGEADLPGRASAVFVSTDDTNPRLHEFGHNINISHTAFTGSEPGAKPHQPTDGTISRSKADYEATTAFGFDVNNSSGSRIYNSNVADFMSYGRPRWTSAFNYNRVFNFFAVPGSSSSSSSGASASKANETTETAEAGVPTNAVQVAAEKLVLVDGIVSFTQGTGELGSVFVMNARRPVTLPDPGSYAIRFENGQGQALATYSFQPVASADTDFGVVSLLLPWDTNARRIVLLRDGQPIASRQASANAPTVTVSSPNGGETLNGATTTFTWTANDADGDQLVYSIDYSTDAGATWKNLVAEWSSTSYQVDLTKVAGSSQALLRVMASDGFHTAQDQSDATFTVAEHAPRISTTTPEDNRLYVGDQTIILEGKAFDVEDGLLSDASLTWSSTLNGTLGTGRSLAVSAATLQEGTHTITLTARDSSGQIATSNSTISVVRTGSAEPVALTVGPTTLSFRAVRGSEQTPAQEIAIRASGNDELTFMASVDQPWLRLGASSGTTPANLSITVDPTGLAMGQYTGHVTIMVDGTTPQTVEVGFLVAEATNIIEFSTTNVSVSEVSGAVSISVRRTGDTSQPATVDYATADGTATAGSDYAATSGTLTFAAGETSKTFTVTVFTDRVNERDENFLVNLTGISNAAFSNREMQVTITNTPAKRRSLRRRF